MYVWYTYSVCVQYAWCMLVVRGHAVVYVEYALCMFSLHSVIRYTWCMFGIRGICSAYFCGVGYVNAFFDGMIVCQQTLNRGLSNVNVNVFPMVMCTLISRCNVIYVSRKPYCVHLIFCTENN